MICNFCGHEVDDKVSECPYCHYIFEKDAQVLSSQERDNFDGITIDEEGNADDHSRQNSSGNQYGNGYRTDDTGNPYRQQQNPNIKVYPLGCGSSMLMTLLILGGILALFFFLLPTFLVFAAIGAVVVFILRLFM